MTNLSALVVDQNSRSVIRKDWSVPDPFFNGYKIRMPLGSIQLVASEDRFRLLSAAMSRRPGFVFVASIKQHKKNQGTIVSIIPLSSSGSQSLSRFATMALVSDARSSVIKLIYGVDGTEYKVTFKTNNAEHVPAHVSWKRILLEVDGDVATLFVDCQKIKSKLIKSQFYKNFNPDVTKMMLASAYTSSNGHRYDDFKVRFIIVIP